VLVSEFDFHLPPELIAQHPLAERADSRLLHVDRQSGEFRDAAFRDFPEMLGASDLLVMNNTRVLPARLFARRSGARAQPLSPQNPAMKEFLQGRVEVLLTRQLGESPSNAPQTWEALVRPGRKIGVGEQLVFSSDSVELRAEVIARGEFGERTLRFEPVSDFFAALEQLGHIPLPPYIDRADTTEDRVRYQTVYAERPGSVAAPTAGLHFTPEVLGRIRERGVEIAEITLHVGLGTFQPIRGDVVEQHKLHTERYVIGEDAAERINRARREGRRVVAVGTTTVRTLEFAARQASGAELTAHSGEADIFIYPGYQFRLVGAMLTNFHLPKSTLLMLVSAFAGREKIIAAYEHAVRERYRFFSYGDCMFVE
jgi:S-adenosylmethionine:tRNA ribosyltransferase-isomerase